MSKKAFDDFLTEQSEKKQNEPKIDWDNIRDRWLKCLELFYDTIEEYLSEYKNAEKLDYDFLDKEISEDYIGTYSVRVMNIRLGEHKVKLEPVGTNLIGAHGRVDLIGVNGKVKFVLVNKNYAASSPFKITISVEGQPEPTSQENEKTELEWKIATPPPRIRLEDLEKEVFLDALLEVIGG